MVDNLINIARPGLSPEQRTRRHPDWLKVPMPVGQNYRELKGMLRELQLHTVCEEARCPNIGECFNMRTATFMILGDICTRGCRYCAVGKGKPGPIDLAEPENLGLAVKRLNLRHVVITSVDRDDQPDGGAAHFARCIESVRRNQPGITIEVLIPDFQGDAAALAVVLDAKPEILNHNTETVPRLYRKARPKAGYEQSLTLLERAKKLAPTILTKTGVMCGLGEEWAELLQTMRDIRAHQVDILTLGQYLAPSNSHLPIARYYTPEEFRQLKEFGLELGFRHVESGPLVRSSYHAADQALSK